MILAGRGLKLKGAQEYDRAIGFKDRNRKDIFANDIVQWKPDHRQSAQYQGAIFFNRQENNFVVRNLTTGHIDPLFIGGQPLLGMDDLLVISYIFINSQLKDLLGED